MASGTARASANGAYACERVVRERAWRKESASSDAVSARNAATPRSPMVSASWMKIGHRVIPAAGVHGKIAGTNAAAYTAIAKAMGRGTRARTSAPLAIPATAHGTPSVSASSTSATSETIRTGRRPKRSLRFPISGAQRNCMTA